MSGPQLVPASADFKDRRGGLIGCGILLILIGGICALFVPLIILAQTMAARAVGGTVDYRMIAPGAAMYGVLAVAFVWLGAGSIMARRWARALLLILSWGWLLVGVVTIGFMTVLLPRVFAAQQPNGQQLSESMRTMVTVMTLGMCAVMFLLLPGVLLLFYRSPHVKATCDARDPVPRWTDACPLPVVALSLMMAFGALSVLPMLLLYHSVMPFFGRLVTGAPATFLLLAMTALWSYLAWATYKLQPRAWWVAVILYGVLIASAILTFWRVDLAEMYRLMGYPEQQIEQIQRSGILDGPYLALICTAIGIPTLGYMIWVKKYFRRPA
jgi:hypothetical protein